MPSPKSEAGAPEGRRYSGAVGDPFGNDDIRATAFAAVSTAFGSLGRFCLALAGLPKPKSCI